MKEFMIILSSCLMLALASCQRDHLYYASAGTATVLVEPDWSRSGVHPNGVTVYAFNDADGSLYKRFPPVSAHDKCYIKLPEGDFTLIVMNDTPEEFQGRIEFTGEENINTFQAKGVKDGLKTQKLNEHLAAKADAAPDGEYCIVEPDTLAVSVVRGLHISAEQIDYFYNKPQTDVAMDQAIKVKVEPKSVISQVNIVAHVKGLKYARGTTLSYLRGTAGGYYLGKEVNSTDVVSHGFILNNRQFDPGSDSDGTISANFLSFGLIGNGMTAEKYDLDINFVLVNGEDHPMSFDVSKLITIDITLSLQLSLKLDLKVELPEVVTGEEDGGFSTDVSEWDDETVAIPM